MKFELALQLSNLNTIQEIEKKFFKIDEKAARDTASLCIATGHAVHSTNHNGGSHKRGDHHSHHSHDKNKQHKQQQHTTALATTERRG